MTNKLQLMQIIKAKIEHIKNSAIQFDSHKGRLNYAGNLLLYYGSLGHKTRLTWQVKTICNNTLKQLNDLSEISRENFEQLSDCYNHFLNQVANIVKQHWDTSSHARRIESALIAIQYSSIEEQDEFWQDLDIIQRREQQERAITFALGQYDADSMVHKLPTEIIRKIQEFSLS